MLRSWKAFGLTLMAALGMAMLLAGSPGSPGVQPAFADHDEQIAVDVVGGGEADSDFEVTGDCLPSAFDVDDTDSPQVLNCDADDGVANISITPPTGFVLSDIDCDIDDAGTTAGTQSDFDEDLAGSEVDIDIADNEHWICVFTVVASNTPTVTGTPATATPTATGTVTVSTLTVSVAPSTLSCSGSAFVTVVGRNAGGQVVAAGNVTLQTNLGSLTPTSAVDQGAGVLAVLTAPANQGGTATIIASAGGVQGTAQVTINCAQATATSVPATAVPQQPAPIRPPSTGDGGLADEGGWRTIAGLAMLGVAIAGAAATVWKRVRA